MSNPVLVEVIVIFASVGVLLLAVAGWLLRRRARAAALQPGPKVTALSIWTPKVIALTVLGAGITLLFVGGVNEIVKHNFRTAAWLLFVGAGLAVVFFRHRKIALAMIVPSVLFAMTMLPPPLHHTLLAITIGLMSLAFLLVFSMWLEKRYPHMKRSDLKKIFDRDPT